MVIKSLRNMMVDGKTVSVGGEVETSEETGTYLINIGKAVAVAKKKPGRPKKIVE